jgi:hypothetical protein
MAVIDPSEYLYDSELKPACLISNVLCIMCLFSLTFLCLCLMRVFKKNPKYVPRFGQYNILSQNTAVIDVLSALVVERQLHTANR